MDYKQQADKIITDYYNTGRLKVRIDGYYKGKLHISRYTKIAEEVYLQVWLELSKYLRTTMPVVCNYRNHFNTMFRKGYLICDQQEFDMTFVVIG